MARSSVDQAFLHFQKTGDVDALSAVFDGTASRLMLVARNLTDDIHSAEDLVQATYLVAIERRERYQPTATVLSWLLGILTVNARQQRRLNQRKLDPARLPAEVLDEPVETIEKR